MRTRAQEMGTKAYMPRAAPTAMLRVKRSITGDTGFTFVELMVVLALLGLLITIVGPYLVVEDRLSATARHLVRLLDELQVTAADTHMLWRVRIDLDRRMYWVTVVEAGGERQPTEIARWASPFLLPGKVRIQQISTVRDRQAEAGQVMVQVFPDNRPEPFTIHLLDEANNFMAVTTHPVTGQVEIATRPLKDEPLIVVDDRLRPLLFPVVR